MDSRSKEDNDPILQMRGAGKEIWADTDADEYVRALLANWYGDTPAVDNDKARAQDSADLE